MSTDALSRQDAAAAGYRPMTTTFTEHERWQCERLRDELRRQGADVAMVQSGRHLWIYRRSRTRPESHISNLKLQEAAC